MAEINLFLMRQSSSSHTAAFGKTSRLSEMGVGHGLVPGRQQRRAVHHLVCSTSCACFMLKCAAITAFIHAGQLQVHGP